jgi:hypothetical protein
MRRFVKFLYLLHGAIMGAAAGFLIGMILSCSLGFVLSGGRLMYPDNAPMQAWDIRFGIVCLIMFIAGPVMGTAIGIVHASRNYKFHHGDEHA